MRIEVCVEEGWPRRLVWCVVEASDLPAAVAGFYAMHGPACGGTLTPKQFVSVVRVEEI